MIKTNSSTCTKAFYWNDGLLKVVYNSGGIYYYEGVSEKLYNELKTGDSTGKTLAKIRQSCRCYKQIK